MLKDNLLEIGELQQLLGYAKKETAIAWCEEHNILTTPFGKKTYLEKMAIDKLLNDALKISVEEDDIIPESEVKEVIPKAPEKLEKPVTVKKQITAINPKGGITLNPVGCPIGLQVYCNKCKAPLNESRACKNRKEPGKCDPSRHRYRLQINTKETGRLFVTKPFDFVFDEEQAKKIAIELRAEIIKNGGKVQLTPKQAEEKLDYGLVEVLMRRRLAFMRDEDKEPHEKRHLEENWVARTEQKFEFMKEVIESLGLNFSTFRVEHFAHKLNDGRSIMGVLHDAICNIEGRDGQIKNPTINDYLKCYGYLFDFAIKKYGLEKNPFADIPLKKENPNWNVNIISEAEFKELCQHLEAKHELSVYFPSGERKNMYRDYLIDFWKLGLFAGFRNYQLAQLRFSNILLSDAGTLIDSIIEVEDYKTNKQHKFFREEEKRYNYVRVNYDLAEFIETCGWSQLRNTDQFLVVRDSDVKRVTIANQISKSFGQYANRLFPDRGLIFKHLRKTHMSSMTDAVGAERTGQVWHGDSSVTKANYIYFKKLIPSADEFRRIF